VDPRSGIRELAWDGRDNSGRLVAGGMYMVRVSATGEGKTSTVTNKAVSLDK
jgi:flagellar hook assembly protein FlgD